MRFILLFILMLPIVELTVLVKVASGIGVLATIALVILASIIGSAILKHQGLHTLSRANWRMQAGELPTSELREGFLIAIGGLLFLIPGFVTDMIGLIFLIPLTRKLLAKYLFSNSSVNGFTYTQHTEQYTQDANGNHTVKVIEGEVISKERS